jgi:hypothetical protein
MSTTSAHPTGCRASTWSAPRCSSFSFAIRRSSVEGSRRVNLEEWSHARCRLWTYPHNRRDTLAVPESVNESVIERGGYATFRRLRASLHPHSRERGAGQPWLGPRYQARRLPACRSAATARPFTESRAPTAPTELMQTISMLPMAAVNAVRSSLESSRLPAPPDSDHCRASVTSTLFITLLTPSVVQMWRPHVPRSRWVMLAKIYMAVASSRDIRPRQF